MKKLYLSEEDKKIAGVCGGIGETYDIDPTLIRLGLVFIGLVTAVLPTVIFYIIAWIVMPRQHVPGQAPAASNEQRVSEG